MARPKPPQKIIYCKCCEKELIVNATSNQQYCNRECMFAYYKIHGSPKRIPKEKVLCSHCGNDVEVSKKRAEMEKSGIRKFCSLDCYSKWLASDKNPLRLPKMRICEFCKKEFCYRNKNLGTKYCSMACSGKASSLKEKLNNRIKKTCAFCKKEYEVWPYRKDSVFCSVECFNLSRHETKDCPACGKSFSGPRNSINKYCSMECSKTSKISVSRGEKEVVAFITCNGYDVKCQHPVNFDGGFYKPDIIVENKVIEYYGTYWHCHVSLFPDENNINLSTKHSAKYHREHDEKRIKILTDSGYEVMIVWEHDWNQNRAEIKKNILEFLK